MSVVKIIRTWLKEIEHLNKCRKSIFLWTKYSIFFNMPFLHKLVFRFNMIQIMLARFYKIDKLTLKFLLI